MSEPCQELGDPFTDEDRHHLARAAVLYGAIAGHSKAVAAENAVLKNYLTAAEKRIAELTEALELIDLHGCSHFSSVMTETRCLSPDSGKVRGFPFGHKSWCDACIARAALTESEER
jgi:hypothetical protein